MKKTMKMIVIAALVMVLALAGCGKKDAAAAVLEGQSASQIIDKIYETTMPEFPLMTMDVDLSDPDMVTYITGLSDASLISEAAVSEPMTGSQAYSLVVARLAEGADAQAVADGMKAGIDPAKWICVMADDIRAVACGDVVMLIMVSSEFAPDVTSDVMVDAFLAACEMDAVSVEAK